jgi:hypothetical protein
MRKLSAVLALAAVAAVASYASTEVITTIVDPYLRIQTALSDDSFEGVAADAKAIATEAGKLGQDGRGLATAAKALETAKDIKSARAAFGELSDALLAYAQSTKSPLGPNVNVAYCSMNKKSWAQKGDKIANPYYGKEMKTCGELKKKAS